MAKHFDAEVRKAVSAVRSRRIFDRIVEVIRYMDGMRDVECADYVRWQGTCELTIAGASTRLTYQTFGQFHEHGAATAHYGGLLVFHATRFAQGAELRDSVDPRRVIRAKDYTIIVEVYLPGIWTKALNVEQLKRRAAAAERALDRQRALLRRGVSPPARENDIDMAVRFGLQYP